MKSLTLVRARRLQVIAGIKLSIHRILTVGKAKKPEGVLGKARIISHG